MELKPGQVWKCFAGYALTIKLSNKIGYIWLHYDGEAFTSPSTFIEIPCSLSPEWRYWRYICDIDGKQLEQLIKQAYPE